MYIEALMDSIRAAEEHRQHCCFHRMHPRVRIDDPADDEEPRVPARTIPQLSALPQALPTRRQYQPSGQLRRNVNKHSVELGMRLRCPMYGYDSNNESKDGCAALRLPTCYLVAPSEQYSKVEKKEECPVFQYAVRELR